jgi:hypothetical protein
VASLREIVLARINCPTCTKIVEVKAQLGTEASSRIGTEYTVKIGLQGIWVEHDCRPKAEAAS